MFSEAKAGNADPSEGSGVGHGVEETAIGVGRKIDVELPWVPCRVGMEEVEGGGSRDDSTVGAEGRVKCGRVCYERFYLCAIAFAEGAGHKFETFAGCGAESGEGFPVREVYDVSE